MSTNTEDRSVPRLSTQRIHALVLKETLQIFRDPSSIAIGIVLPLLLILLFGYGVSLNVENVQVGIVAEDHGFAARELQTRFQLSRYFNPIVCDSMAVAERKLQTGEIEAIIRWKSDFSKRFNRGDAAVEVLVHGTDANRARIVQRYAQGVIGQWSAIRAGHGDGAVVMPAVLSEHVWFNKTLESRFFLVPGLIVLIMTLIGALLTALVMSREWERGTLEALFVTPVQVEEILLGKTIPYFFLGLVGFGLCMLAARFLFHVPFRGSIIVLTTVSMLYLLVALGLGLCISSLVKSQFVASQITLLTTFMPALMLSGFLFDLRSMPAPVRAVTYLLPAKYYVTLLQTIFLAGTVWPVIIPNAAILLLMAVLLLSKTRRITHKRLV